MLIVLSFRTARVGQISERRSVRATCHVRGAMLIDILAVARMVSEVVGRHAERAYMGCLDLLLRLDVRTAPFV